MDNLIIVDLMVNEYHNLGNFEIPNKRQRKKLENEITPETGFRFFEKVFNANNELYVSIFGNIMNKRFQVTRK